VENWQRVNRLVKGRAGYRPLAPAVLADAAADWFELPKTRGSLDYMGCVVGVRESRRAELAAVTHVDGTARVQLVRPETNKGFARLLRSFGELTGVPVLLNTSFNNDAEPIVQTVDDAIVCYLTTGLDHLVIGDFLVTRAARPLDLRELVPALAPAAELLDVRVAAPEGGLVRRRAVRRRQDQAGPVPVGDDAYDLLSRSDGKTAVRTLAPSCGAEVLAELRALWGRRLITLTPAG
jgi:hypothetical protein